ncbi:MAG: hypothetical protein JW765_01995 [Deltaproteobacteria bacterium]|nr:hypothetical protein [Candidatus Zymogenaceae bacterium]
MRKTIVMAAAAIFLCAVSAAAGGELVDTRVEKFGYAVAIPVEFFLDGTVSDTAAWTYLPDSSTVPPGPALTIWVNRVQIQTPGSRQLFDINKKSDTDAAGAPDAPIKDLTVLDIRGGYGYWYKESDKTDPAEIHRWVVKVFGNGGVYILCFSGPSAEFAAWEPVFERVIGSFTLIIGKAG